MTKEYIEKNLLTKNKGLDSNKRKQTNLTIEELYLIYHNIEVPLCGCGQKRKFYNFINGHKEYCSTGCIFAKTNKRKKTDRTNIEKYGSRTPLQNKEVKEKIRETNKERYGVENVFQSEEIKEKMKKTNIEKYNSEYSIQSKEIQEKIKKTNKERYGTENVFQSKEIQEKIKKTNKERYGVENVFQSKEIKEKMKKTNIEKYNVEYPSQSPLLKEKKKQTSLKNYGTEYPLQSTEIRERIKATNKERYGFEYPSKSLIVKEKIKTTNIERYNTENPFQREEIKEKIKTTNIERYGTEYPSQSLIVKEKIKTTNIERFGVEYPFQSLLVKEKVKKTNIERFGVEYPAQSEEIKEKIKEINIEKYGFKYATQNPEIKEKTKKTNKEIFGVEYPAQSEEIKEKTKKTNKERYGVEHPEQSHFLNFDNLNEEYIRLNFIKDNMFLFEDVMNYFNISDTKLYKLKIEYNITESNLFNKIRLEDRINTLFDNVFTTNTKSIIKPLELDLYNPKFKFAIEYDGLMFHSSGNSAYSMFTDTDKNYHLNKTLRCEEKDIILFHIFENEWLNEGTRDIWISKINSMLKRNKTIEANIIKEIDYNISYIFIQENCLEQNIYNENIGLFYENELVMVISLEEDIFKVVSKKHLDIVNGKEILIDYITEKYKRNFKTVINRRWYSGDYINYNKTYTEPDCFYFGKSLILEDKPQENYRKIWDCGNIILGKEYIEENLLTPKGRFKKTSELIISAEELYLIYHNIEVPLCGCGQKRRFYNFVKGYRETCGTLCVFTELIKKEKMKKTNLERYGVENARQNKSVQEKIKQTNIERYGVENVRQNKSVQEKIKQTNIERYGTEYGFQNKSVQEKIKKTNIERYGAEHITQNIKIKEKIKKTNIERYGHKASSQNIIVKEKAEQTNIERYGVKHTSQKHILNFNNLNEEYIRLNFIKDNTFLFEDVMSYFNISTFKIRTLKLEYNITESNLSTKPKLEDRINDIFDNAFITNTKSIIKPLELDLYSLEFKFAIEYDGLMFHSSGENTHSMFKDIDKNYHLDKTLRCEEKGIILFHIFENEWLNEGTRDIWISKINSILKRNKIIETNTIKEINYNTAKEFIQENCLEQNLYNENIGLLYEDELVMVISLEEDIFKVASKKHINIINGKEILINYIIEKYKRNFKTIINRRWYSGDYINYNKTHTEPNCFYFKGLKVIDKHQENYRKIWDCGNIILEREILT